MDKRQAAEPGSGGGTPVEGLREVIGETCETARRQLAGILELATLEVRYSSLMLAASLGLAVVVALSLLVAWGLFAAAMVAGLTAGGWSWMSALALVGAFHLLVAVAALVVLRGCLARVGMDSTRAALGLEHSGVPE